MDTLLQNEEKKTGINKMLLAAIGIAVLLVAGIAGLLMLKPSVQEQKKQLLEGAVREGSPEFAELTKKVLIRNDAENTMESPTGLGTITMFNRAEIVNISKDQTIDALEIRVSVLDPMGKPIKEKTMTVVPWQDTESLAPQQRFPVTVPIEGFAKDDDRARVQWKVTAIRVRS